MLLKNFISAEVKQILRQKKTEREKKPKIKNIVNMKKFKTVESHKDLSHFYPVLRIRDVYTGSRIRIFPSRISDPGSRVKKIPDPGSRIRIRIKEFKYF